MPFYIAIITISQAYKRKRPLVGGLLKSVWLAQIIVERRQFVPWWHLKLRVFRPGKVFWQQGLGECWSRMCLLGQQAEQQQLERYNIHAFQMREPVEIFVLLQAGCIPMR
jgi:hypothetical protein